MLWVALHFPSRPPLEPLAGWACQFTPRVSLEPPQALLAEVRGSLRCFGGRASLLGRLRRELGAMGLEVALGAAATPRAALWIARGGGLRLEALPVERSEEHTSELQSHSEISYAVFCLKKKIAGDSGPLPCLRPR